MRQLSNLLFFLICVIICISIIPIAYANQTTNNTLGGWSNFDNLNGDGASYQYSDNFVNKAPTSFVTLPLWVKLLTATALFLSLLALIKIIPFIIGRLKGVLDNKKRQAILKYVQENPGCTVADIVDNQNINRGTVKYHIFQLELNGKIFQKRVGKFSRLFHKTTQIRDIESIVTPYLRNDTSKSILKAIMDNPGITNQELSTMFNLDKSTIHWYLQKFSTDGVIKFRQVGKFRQCTVNDEAKMVLLRFMPA